MLRLGLLMLAALVAGCGGGGGGGSSAGGVGTATVSGVVTDSSGAPVEGAVVIVGTASWTATTGPDGSYVIPNVPVGTHPVKALKDGYDLGSLGSVTVSGGGTVVDNVTLPPPSGTSPVLTGLTIDPSSGPSGTTATVHVEVENVTSAGTVRLASPELEQTWTMTRSASGVTRPASGNTYTATVPITAKTGILKYRFFAAAYEGTKAGVTGAATFTLTGGASNANVTGVWKFFINQTSPTNDNGIALAWIKQAADNTLTIFDFPRNNGGSVSGNAVTMEFTIEEGTVQTITATVTGRQMDGTYSTSGGGRSGTFKGFLAMEDGAVPASTGSGPVTLTTGRYFDLSSGRTLSTATAADFGVTLGASVGSIVSVPTDGIGWNQAHNIEGFRIDLAIQSSPLSSLDWVPSKNLYDDTYSYLPATYLVKTAEGKYGLVWVSAASASGVTFRYQYPYASATPDTVGPSVPTGLTATAVSSTQVNLTWDANPEGDVAGYVLWRMPDNAIIDVGPSSSPSYSNTGLTPGTTYTYRLAANDGSSGSGWGDPVVVTTPVATFSNASLNGNWYSANMEVGGDWNSAATGAFTFNGAGSHSALGVYSLTTDEINQPYSWSSTYSVSSNGDVLLRDSTGSLGDNGKLALTSDFAIFARVQDVEKANLGLIVKPGSGMDNSSLSGRYWTARYSMGTTRQSGFYLNTFDGVGGYTYAGSYSDNASGGSISDSGSRNYSVADNGAYSSATGVSTYDGGVSADGDVYVVARVQNPSQRAIGIGIKAGSSGYSTAGVSGTYKCVYLAQDDAWGPVTVIGTITLNGAGGYTLAGVRASVSDPIANQTISRSGTYSVASDGRLTITNGDGVFDGGISADGNQFLAALVGGDGSTQAVMIGTK